MNKLSTIISVVIPCRNEAGFIGKCVNSLLNQHGFSKGEIEIIVVDGESADGTREILASYRDSSVKVLNNPQKITPVALNLGIKAAKGNFIAILGAHSVYPPEYLANSLQLFEKGRDIIGVGGPIFSEGTNDFSKATALCMSSVIGVGNAKHRFPDYEGYAEMACFPVFHKSAFEKAGYYDEELIRNQDDEFCFRLRKKGYKIYISPSVQAKYYVRSKPGALFSQYFHYGYWRVWVLKKHKIPISFRQLIPSSFFLILLFLLIFGLFKGNLLLALSLPGFYLTFLIIFASLSISKIGFKPATRIPSVLFILHFSYAIGFFKGIFDVFMRSNQRLDNH